MQSRKRPITNFFLLQKYLKLPHSNEQYRSISLKTERWLTWGNQHNNWDNSSKKKEASLQICVHSSSDLPPPHELEVRTPICQRWRCPCWHNTRSAATSGAVLLSKLGSLTLLTVCPSWTNKQHCKNPKFCCKEGAFGFYWSSVARKRHFEMKSDITKSLYPCLFLSPLCRAAWSNTWTDDKEVWKEEKFLRLEGLEYYTE